MLTEGTYRTDVSTSFELSRVHTAAVVRLWRMIVVSEFGFWAFLSLYPTVHIQNSQCALPRFRGRLNAALASGSKFLAGCYLNDPTAEKEDYIALDVGSLSHSSN
jgi:hypothetical protein